jgi:hypothetical protein
MSYLVAAPDTLAAATDVASLGSTLSAARMAAAARTIAVTPAVFRTGSGHGSRHVFNDTFVRGTTALFAKQEPGTGGGEIKLHAPDKAGITLAWLRDEEWT